MLRKKCDLSCSSCVFASPRLCVELPNSHQSVNLCKTSSSLWKKYLWVIASGHGHAHGHEKKEKFYLRSLLSFVPVPLPDLKIEFASPSLMIDFLLSDRLPLLETMEQKTYPFPLKGVDPDALYVMEKLRQAGYTAYLVGGSVRDLVLQKTPKDYDISTSAKPEEIKRLFRNCILIGRRFRLAHIRFGKKILEVSTFRTGDLETDALIVRDNEWGNPEQDVLRRDFTINGLFYDPSTETIIDYVEGYPDLQKQYLRTIGQPYLRFKQDPVRMLRLLKFQARFGFEIDKDAHISLLECRHEILKSSPSRVLEELLRMLESGSAKPFFKLLAEHGMLQMLLPALSKFLDTPDGKEVYDYLEEVDTTFHAPGEPLLERPSSSRASRSPYCKRSSLP